jgi:hypothetical protein
VNLSISAMIQKREGPVLTTQVRLSWLALNEQWLPKF